jgi:hypothetical protein
MLFAIATSLFSPKWCFHAIGQIGVDFRVSSTPYWWCRRRPVDVDSAYHKEEPSFPVPRSVVDGYHHYDVIDRDALPTRGLGGMSLRRLSQRKRRGRPPRVDDERSENEVRPGDPLPDPVDRDNCPRCNTRFDIGCRHRRAPLSMGAW